MKLVELPRETRGTRGSPRATSSCNESRVTRSRGASLSDFDVVDGFRHNQMDSDGPCEESVAGGGHALSAG